MTVARSAPSSRSWHERDDAAERNFLICDHLWVNAMPVEQLAMARRLARERCALAEVPSLRRVVRTREARSEQSIAFRLDKNYSTPTRLKVQGAVPYDVVLLCARHVL